MASQPNDAPGPLTVSTMVCYFFCLFFLFWARTQSYQSLGISCAQSPKTLGGTVGPMYTSTVSFHPTFSLTLTLLPLRLVRLLCRPKPSDTSLCTARGVAQPLGINSPRPGSCDVARPFGINFPRIYRRMYVWHAVLLNLSGINSPRPALRCCSTILGSTLRHAFPLPRLAHHSTDAYSVARPIGINSLRRYRRIFISHGVARPSLGSAFRLRAVAVLLNLKRDQLSATGCTGSVAQPKGINSLSCTAWPDLKRCCSTI